VVLNDTRTAISPQYGYLLDDFDRHWFGRGGMSMQACLLLDVEPYLDRDDVSRRYAPLQQQAVTTSRCP
jgi:hypothetical protein